MAEPSHIPECSNNLHAPALCTDFTIRINNYEYSAHKAVLSASSDYFKAMFRFNQYTGEPQTDSVTMDGVSVMGFEFLLNYMYSLQFELIEETVEEVLTVAAYLQIPPVLNICLEYLKNSFSYENCIGILQIAETCASNNELKASAYSYMCSNLSLITERGSIENLSAEHVENILKCDLPVDCTEDGVFYFVTKWFFSCADKDVPKRLQLMPNILKHVRYEQITSSKFAETLSNIPSQFGPAVPNVQLYKDIVENVVSIKPLGSELSCSTFSSRGMERALVLVGGVPARGAKENIIYSLLGQRNWECLTKKHHYGFDAASDVLDNCLYVAGGVIDNINEIQEETVVNCTYKYNPRLDSWTNMKEMQTSRSSFTLTACDGKLYAIAGVTELLNAMQCKYTRSCEYLDPRKDAWEYIDRFPEYTSCHAAAAVFVNGAHKLYVSGGTYEGDIKDTMYCFDTSDNTWHTCSPLLTPRWHHFMFAHGKKVYVIGGCSSGENEKGKVVTTVDVYDCVSDTWAVITDLPRPKNLASYGGHGSKIYGGMESASPVHCFDILTNKWELGIKNGPNCTNPRCHTLFVSKTRNVNYKNPFL